MSERTDTSIINGAVHAATAQASYADLVKGTILPSKLTGQDMTEAQANAFSETYTVVEQFHGTFGGSATVFENRVTGEISLSIRGTDSALDALTGNISIALGLNTINAQYGEIKTQVDRWMAAGKLPQNFEVDGHSAGGTYAVLLKNDLPKNITHVNTYNAPAEGGIWGSIVSLFGLSTTLVSPH